MTHPAAFSVRGDVKMVQGRRFELGRCCRRPGDRRRGHGGLVSHRLHELDGRLQPGLVG